MTLIVGVTLAQHKSPSAILVRKILVLLTSPVFRALLKNIFSTMLVIAKAAQSSLTVLHAWTKPTA
jgi:hypothetical protein